MRTVFLGTPQFAVPTLEALIGAGHDVAAVFTQPDRPRGRGQHASFPPVKEAALRHNLAVHQPERIRRPEAVEILAGLHADAMVVVGYGQIIPQSILDLPPRGIINMHASLLPKYRGAAPIQWAIANGETVTGVTTMCIDAGLDTGDILLKEAVAIGDNETAVELAERLSKIGADLLIRTLRQIDSISPEKQDPSQASYAPLLKKEDGIIDWKRRAAEIHNQVRGFQPWPGAYTAFRGQTLHLWKTRIAAAGIDLAPGTLVPEKRRLLAACGSGTALEILELQLEGRKRMDAASFINGQRLSENESLGEKES